MESAAGLRSDLSSFALAFLALPLASAFSLSSLSSRHSIAAERIAPRADQNTTSIPAAIEIAPSQYWDGNDGPWSSFPLQLGTPAQNIRAFVSTASPDFISVGANGCPANYTTDCANKRGFLFLTNESLSWIPNSIYNLGIEDNLGLDIASNVGFDTATLGWQGAGGPTLEHSTIFNVYSAAYWIGLLGVKPQSTNFTNLNDPQPSFMNQLKSNNTIPSLSYGYTAGNQYRLNKVFGSLVLGGYDQNRFNPTQNVSIGFYADVQRDLLVNIQSITTDTGSPSNLLPGGGITAFIDSTIAQLWLPETACTAFEQAFGLTFDETSQYYLVNSSLHDTLTSSNPNVTFTIGSSNTGGETVDIVLPYGAFDLQLEYPNVANTSYYFPLKRAANDTQYTLGRTFLQEAYIIADYDKANFTIAPCIWDQDKVSTSSIKSIVSQSTTSTGSSGSSSNVGAIAGGVVGGVVALVAIIAAALFWLRRKKQVEKKRLAELDGKGGANISNSNEDAKPFISKPIGGELAGEEIHEMNAPYKPNAQEMDSPYKVDPNRHGYAEMEGGATHYDPAKHGVPAEMHGSTPIFEMAGSDVHEMPNTSRGPPPDVKR